MPKIESELVDIGCSKAFAASDFCSGYWQSPLQPESQNCFAFGTSDGVFMPTDMTQGGCNSTANFQEKVEQCFPELKEHLKACIDESMLFARTGADMRRLLRLFFEICRARLFVVSLPKSELYLSELTWCGSIVDAQGFCFHLKNIDRLMNCDYPVTTGELCEYVRGLNWSYLSIRRFDEHIAPLRQLLEAA